MSRLSRLAVLAVLLCTALAGGCGKNKVTHSNIDRWVGIEGGEKKLERAIKGSYSASLRGHAVAALVQASRAGVTMASDALGRLGEGDRQAAMTEAVNRMIETAKVAENTSPQMPQVAAKDALFGLRDLMSAADRDRVDAFLVAWLTGDVVKRWSAGLNNGDKILEKVGAGAAPELRAALERGTLAVKEVALTLGRVGSPEDRLMGVKAVLAAFEKVGGSPDDNTLIAVGSLGGPDATSWFMELIKDPDNELRFKVLQALGKGPDKKALLPALDMALGIAVNPAEEGKLRDEAFGVIQAIGGQAAIDGMVRVKLFEDAKEVVRFEAYEVALRGSRELAIGPVLESLPTARDFSGPLLDKYILQFIRPLGPLALPALRKALESKNWVARLAAVELLGELGEAADLPRLEALSKDATKLKGWTGEVTLGQRATAAAEKLKTKS